jgi:hypothetical protein
MEVRGCSHPGCGGTHKARGLCKPHYEQSPDYRKRVSNRKKLSRSTPEGRAAQRLAKWRERYGIDEETYEKMLAEQAHVCRICSSPPSALKRLCVDHCHRTGKIRGLLCDRCNVAIGLFGDSEELLVRTAAYLAGTLR